MTTNPPRLPERWVSLYTRGLPREARDARRDEIACDVYEHCASNGNNHERGVRAAVVGRTLRGMGGDVMWRYEEGRAMKQQRRELSGRPVGLRAAWATVTQSWFTPLAVLVGLADIAFAIYVVLDDEGKMPGQAIGPVLLVGFAAAMFAGLWLRWRAMYGAAVLSSGANRRANRRSSILVVLAALAIVAIALGVVISGSMVVVFVGVLALGGAVVAARRRRGAPATERAAVDRPVAGPQSVVLAEVLIVAGTLPALALFWFVIPAVLAIVVIGGVLGTNPKPRREVAV